MLLLLLGLAESCCPSSSGFVVPSSVIRIIVSQGPGGKRSGARALDRPSPSPTSYTFKRFTSQAMGKYRTGVLVLGVLVFSLGSEVWPRERERGSASPGSCFSFAWPWMRIRMLPSSCPQVSSSTSSRAASLERSQVEPGNWMIVSYFIILFGHLNPQKFLFPGIK